jgi:hypothetical protein
MNKKNKLNLTFRVIKEDKTIDRCQTHSIRRFSHRIRTINWQNKPFKVYLRVNYGKELNHKGKYENFYNHGTYKTKTELLQALNAFTE